MKFWRKGLIGNIVGGVIILAIIAAGVIFGLDKTKSSDEMHLTAYFTRTIGLYPGNAVDVMGVKIGTITSLTDEGPRVKAEISYDGSQKLPANVRAVIVTPSVVSDRFIDLTPVYRSGPTLADNQVLNTNRTAVPIEFDDIFKNLNKLNVALDKTNKHGALQDLIKTGYENLHGNGKRLHSALYNFTQAISTLSGNRGNLFQTVAHLQQFTATLAHDDGGIRALNSNLDRVGRQLVGERHDLAAALTNLSSALKLVNTFVASNKDELTRDIHGATQVSRTLQAEKGALTQIINDAPIAVSNLALAGDPKANTLDTKASLTYGVTPAQLCNSFVTILKKVPGLGGLLGKASLCSKISGASSTRSGSNPKEPSGTTGSLSDQARTTTTGPSANGLSQLLGSAGK